MKNTIDTMQRFVALWKNRGFSEEGGISIGIIAGSKQAIDVFGNEEKAFQKLIDVTENSKSEEEALNSFYDMVQ